MFNMFLADFLFILNNVDIAINGVIQSLEKASKVFFEWFENIFLKSNADKCHFLVSFSGVVRIRVSECDIENSKWEKLLGLKFENKQRF